ncbi:chemotaxis protein CheA [Oscillatoria salina]|uniref:chemotaxis protein CheA n=1 Tax=Oscillatoria salina TaxID=331517 RepID=UPI0013B6D37A|nr:chemotaxis protein CheA [Oscillatoria salina]MBZ8180362.1 chemotaxis protein CheA [Oscillatoria salina IIICB1]NET87960.1 chemotaxis protein CheA [Kamptonema sp. SIO1D9]
MDEDIQAFLADNSENLEQIERDLVALEQNPSDGELLVRIYRSLHTIKGNCGFMAFTKLEALTHAGENLLSRLRDEELVLNAELTSILLQLIDAIQQSCTWIETTGEEGDLDYSELIQRLNNLHSTNPSTISQVSENSQPLFSMSGSIPSDRTQTIALTKTQIYDKETESNQQVKEEKTPRSLTTSHSVQSIRVDINLLDKLMNLVGELVLVRNQILQFDRDRERADFETASEHLNRLTTELQEGVMKTRMQPISTIWKKFPRVVRDLAIASDKQVQVQMEGEETELDKTIVEAIKDPLTHILRNCIDHGIETPDLRRLSGKPESGNLYLHASHESGYVNIKISDDGAGIDPEKVKQKALALELITLEECNRLSDTEAIDLIFLPGFSLAEKVTRLSGRGVGMDVVKSNIEKVGGTVEVHSQRQLGTTFKLKIPLTLAIIPALIVSSGSDRYAIPQMSIAELVRLEGEKAHSSIEYIHTAPVYRLRGKLLPLVYLNQELQLEKQPETEEELNIVVVQSETPFGLVVDGIDDIQEIVVKPLGKLLKDTPFFGGVTILGDGNVALILDLNRIAQHSGVLAETQIKAHLESETAQQEDDRQMLLLFEGSPESRMAIPLAMVLRLEEIPHTAVEKIGDRVAIQYRSSILPLIDLASIFSSQLLSVNNPQLDSLITHNHSQDRALPKTRSSLLENEILQIVVVACQNGQTVGLVVQQIIDIAMEKIAVTGAATRPGIEAIAVIQNQVTEILDLSAITQQFLENSRQFY